MNKELLRKHIDNFITISKENQLQFNEALSERQDHFAFYQSYSHNKILNMDESEFFKYISQLWGMLFWGNKKYVIERLIEDNGLSNFKKELASLIWGDEDIVKRWDNFRNKIKGFGPSMMSEVLRKTHPNKYMLWNRRAYVALNYLGVGNLPRYDYQFDGKKYQYLCNVCFDIADELKKSGFRETNLLIVDYFIWSELQVADNLSSIFAAKEDKLTEIKTPVEEEAKFIHNEIRDKLRDIGQWLGFTSKTEQKVAEGSKVDTIWEATIGNMGRVIYVFEVQTKGNVDSLIINLLKALNNPAVQGVVAVSDKVQLERIKSQAADVKDLKDKLKHWDYEEILQVHESLEFINSSINRLGLVPQGF